MAARAAASSWSVIFTTSDGMCHPIRLRYSEPTLLEFARRAAERYRLAHAAWLTGIEQIYPTRDLPEKGVESCHV